jgi:hypothetical protein
MSGDAIKIIGRLCDVPDLGVKCGDTAIAVVFKFDVVSVLEGDCPDSTVLIIVPCPDQNDAQIFVAHHHYVIEAVREFDDAALYAVTDEYACLDLPRYWSDSIDKEISRI